MSCKSRSIQVEAMPIEPNIMATLPMLVHSKESLCTSYANPMSVAETLVYIDRRGNHRQALSYSLYDGYQNKKRDIW